jgi:hypothetical protein
MRPVAARLLATLVAVAIGCGDSAGPVTDQLRAAIDGYRQAKPDASDERITALFARLDADIANLKADAAAKPPGERRPLEERIATLEQERAALQQAYLQARLERLGSAATDTLKSVGKQIGQGLEDAGRQLRESMDKQDEK